MEYENAARSGQAPACMALYINADYLVELAYLKIHMKPQAIQVRRKMHRTAR